MTTWRTIGVLQISCDATSGLRITTDPPDGRVAYSYGEAEAFGWLRQTDVVGGRSVGFEGPADA